MFFRRPKAQVSPAKDKPLSEFTTFFFDQPVFAGLLWLTLIIFGVCSYFVFLKREGFPSVNIPFSYISGTYFVNDPAKVDQAVAKPLSAYALQQSAVKSVQSQSADNFFSVQIQYKEGTNAQEAVNELEKKVKASSNLPHDAAIQYNVPYFGATGGDIQPIDEAVSFYSASTSTSITETVTKAKTAVQYLNDKKLPDVKSVFLKDPFENATDPATGQAVTIQRTFDRFGMRSATQTQYHRSIIIGFEKNSGTDVIKLDKQVRDALADMQKQPQFKGYSAEVSASFAPSIKDNLSELQRVLLEGLIAVLVVGSIVIAIRASFITVLSMITVLLLTLGFLYVIGYSLNVITLFALILGLALIVDDTIIMVEAIDAARNHAINKRQAIREATGKISRAMVAATATACLSFMPLLFVGGILGDFIRAIPVTIVSALVISLFVALVFIPFMARFVLLGKKQMGAHGVKELAAGFEKRLAAFISRPMRWARSSNKRLFGVGSVALIIGFGSLLAGLTIAKDVVFNIFPPTKDTNGLVLSIVYPPNTGIDKAEQIAADADKIAADILGGNYVQGSYYASGSSQSATEQIEIISYNKRKITSPQLVKQLQDRFNTDFKEAKIIVGQSDIGPPSTAFTVQIDATDRVKALKLAQDIADFLPKAELKRTSGKIAHFSNAKVSTPDQFLRSAGKPIVTVSAGFDGNDTTTLVTLAQDAVNKEFDAAKLKQYGLDTSVMKFDIGQESDNQDSFKTLALAFPILLGVMFVLLAFQFRSLLQPLLIFMAIPFSIFGVMLGLRLTNNAISFFTMLGFFALVGLSIKNTILLTDYSNQSRRHGLSAIDAAVAALEERFRPLFATSMTAVVSLTPLAIASPFWQGLAVVLIFGLLSSTLLVLTVFPYYYLGAEYLRSRIRARDFLGWLLATAVLGGVVGAIASPALGLLAIPATLIFVIGRKLMHGFTSRKLL